MEKTGEIMTAEHEIQKNIQKGICQHGRAGIRVRTGNILCGPFCDCLRPLIEVPGMILLVDVALWRRRRGYGGNAEGSCDEACS